MQQCNYAFYYCDCVREAGFEPALPREHRLKRCVLTIRAKHSLGAPCGTRTRDRGLIRPKFYTELKEQEGSLAVRIRRILGGPDPKDPYPYIHGTVYLSGFCEKKHFFIGLPFELFVVFSMLSGSGLHWMAWWL